MTSLLMKIIICPLVLGLSAFVLPNINYEIFFQPIIIGLILAVVGVAMEYMLLRKDRIGLSTLMDFIASVLIIYYGSQFFAGAEATFFGALIVSFILSIIEHMNHKYLVSSGKARKEPEYS